MMNIILLALSLLLPLSASARNTPTDTVQFSTQGSAPGSPASGTVYGYFLTSDGFPYWKNSAGSVFGYLYSSSALTNHGVLIGAGTRAPGATTVGTSSQVLCGSTGADPSFCAVPQLDGFTLNEVSAPSSPASGKDALYFKSDGKLYKKTSAGTESEIGGGAGAGAFNIAILDTAANNWQQTKTYNSDIETASEEWAAYADAAGTVPVDMTGGSPNTTCARNTSSPINGTADLLVTKSSGASRQGEGCSLLINLPGNSVGGYRGQPFRLVAKYTTTGTINSGDFIPYAYDVTNSALLGPSTVIQGITGTQGTLHATFISQTSAAQLRIGLHIAGTTDAAATIHLDDIKVEPDLTQANVPVSDWAPYTPTFSGMGTTSSPDFWWRRNGDSVEIYGSVTLGTTAASEARISLPNGIVIDSTKVASKKAVGPWFRGGASFTSHGGPIILQSGNAYVNFGTSATFDNSSVDPMTVVNGTQLGSSGETVVVAMIRAPISGWSSGGGTSPILSLSDWITNSSAALTPSAGFGTTTNAFYEYRRVGDTAHFWGFFIMGTVAASTASLALPAGMKIDASKLSSNSKGQYLGFSRGMSSSAALNIFNASSGNGFSNNIFYDGSDTSNVYVAWQTDSTGYVKSNGSTLFTNGAYFTFEFSVPISGWTSVSSGTLTAPRDYFHLDTGNGLGSTDTYVRRFTNTRASVGPGFTIADNSTNGTRITINTAGNWCFSYSDARSAGAGVYGITVNDSALTTGVYTMTYAQGRRATMTPSNADNPMNVGWCSYLSVGDVVRAKVNDTTSQSTGAYVEFSGTRMSN